MMAGVNQHHTPKEGLRTKMPSPYAGTSRESHRSQPAEHRKRDSQRPKTSEATVELDPRLNEGRAYLRLSPKGEFDPFREGREEERNV